MHAFESGEPLSDADIDRALAAALAVEPSPEFVARVRQRIARESPPSPWHPSWVFAMAGVCAVAIVAIVASWTLAAPDRPRLAAPGFVASLAAVVPPLTPAPLALSAAASRRSRNSGKPTPELRAVMNANAEASAALRVHLREKDYGALANDAVTYRQNFAYLEGFWAGRDAAVQISSAGLLAAAALEAAARAKDDRALETAIAAILGTCGACHRHYREELPDGTYEIRL